MEHTSTSRILRANSSNSPWHVQDSFTENNAQNLYYLGYIDCRPSYTTSENYESALKARADFQSAGWSPSDHDFKEPGDSIIQRY